MSCGLQIAKENGGKLLRIDPFWKETEQSVAQLERLGAELPGGHANTKHEHLQGQPKYTMDLDLDGYDFDSWLMSISGRRRNYIRRAARENVETYVSTDPSLVDRFYELILASCERQQISHRPKDYFVRLMQAYPDNFYFAVAEHEGHIYSMSLNIVYCNRVSNLYVGNDLSNPKLRAAIAMMTEMIHEAFRRNIRYIDMTGVFGLDRSDHLYKFKVDFMPKDQDATIFAGEIDYTIA